MDFLSLILCVCILLLIIFYKSQGEDDLPPGPRSLPVLGSIPFLEDLNVRRAFLSLAEKYGKVFTVRMGSSSMVILNGHAAIQEAFSKEGKAFAGRPKTFITDQLLGTRGIAGVQGALWKEQRKYFMHDIKTSMPTLEKLILHEMNCLIYEYTRICGRVFNPKTLLQKSLINILTSFSFGFRYEYDDVIFERYDDWMNTISRSSMLFCMPWLRHIPGDLFSYQKHIQTKKAWLDLYKSRVTEHRATVNTDRESQDFVNRYLKAIDANKENPESTFSEEQLVHLMDELVVAGVETTASTLCWAVLFLAIFPDTQTKIYTEIKRKIGPDEQPRFHHLTEMAYTQAAICEIQRLGDVIPLTIPHAATHDVTFHGYHLPGGTQVSGNITSTNMDPDVWSNPHEFDPERFLDADGKFQKQEKFIPFSTGRRMCPADQLAKMEIFICLCSILQAFRIRIPDGLPRPSTQGTLGLTHAPGQFSITIEHR